MRKGAIAADSVCVWLVVLSQATVSHGCCFVVGMTWSVSWPDVVRGD